MAFSNIFSKREPGSDPVAWIYTLVFVLYSWLAFRGNSWLGKKKQQEMCVQFPRHNSLPCMTHVTLLLDVIFSSIQSSGEIIWLFYQRWKELSLWRMSKKSSICLSHGLTKNAIFIINEKPEVHTHLWVINQFDRNQVVHLIMSKK